MPFELIREDTSNEPDLVLAYDANGRPAVGVAPAGEVKFWMRPLRGEDDQAIQDALIQMNRRGKGEVRSGTTDQIKICRSVVRVEGLTINGQPVERLTANVYGLMPKWMIDRLKKKVAEINAEEDVQEVESE